MVEQDDQELLRPISFKDLSGNLSGAKKFIGLGLFNQVSSLKNQMLANRKKGTLSEDTFRRLALDLDKGVSSWFNDTNIGSKANKEFGELFQMFKGEVEGSSPEGRSRLATQKMFQLMQDRPGRTQTLLAPRSNSSKSILGV